MQNARNLLSPNGFRALRRSRGAEPVDVREVEQAGATTVVTAEVGGDGFNGPSHFSFEVDGDRVARMTIRE